MHLEIASPELLKYNREDFVEAQVKKKATTTTTKPQTFKHAVTYILFMYYNKIYTYIHPNTYNLSLCEVFDDANYKLLSFLA